MKRRVPVAAMTALLVVATACGTTAPPPLPEPPSLEAFDEPIRRQYEERRRTLEARLADSGASAAEIAAAFGEIGAWGLVYDVFGTAEPALLEAERRAGAAEWRWSYYLGHLYERNGDPERAREAFRRVLEIQPSDVPARVWLAEVELASGREAVARELFDEAVRRDPACARALVGLGRIDLQNENHAAAVERLSRALALQPDSSEIHYSLGLAYRGHGDREKAEEHMRLGVAGGGATRRRIPMRDPLIFRLQELNASAEFQVMRAREAMEDGRFDEGIELFRAAVAAAPEKLSLRLNLAAALVRTDRFDEAIEQYEAALRIDPRASSPHYNLGRVLEHIGRTAEAERHYREALESDPGHERARAQLEGLLRAGAAPGG